MFDSLGLRDVLINGMVISLVLGVMVLISLKYNARLWLQDYPKPIQDAVPPLSSTEKRQRVVVGAVLIGGLLAGMLLSTVQLRTYPSLSYGTAYLHIFLILLIFNLFDAVVLDLFIITILKPRFVILPGAEGMEYLFNDYRKHVTDFLKGMVFCTIASLPFAAIAMI